MSIQNDSLVTALLSNQLFENVSMEEIQLLSKTNFSQRIYEPGETIIKEGDESNEVFLLVTGVVKILQISSSGAVIELIKRKKSEFIGEMGIIENTLRSTSVVTETSVETIIIDKENFFYIIGILPQTLINVTKIIARRLRESDFRAGNEFVKYQNLLSLNRDIVIQKRTLEKLNKELYQKNEELFKMATIDSLTGIYNRRYIMDIFDRELNNAIRFKVPLSCILLDIDHFKTVNDTYGHAGGDFALVKVGELIRSLIRKNDSVGRYGGEEFIILLPHTNKENAFTIAEKIRQKLQSSVFTYEDTELKITGSFGIMDNLFPEVNLDKMLTMADSALYKAKKIGRNKVLLFTPESD